MSFLTHFLNSIIAPTKRHNHFESVQLSSLKFQWLCHSSLQASHFHIQYHKINWRPPSQSELTTTMFNIGLTHLSARRPPIIEPKCFLNNFYLKIRVWIFFTKLIPQFHPNSNFVHNLIWISIIDINKYIWKKYYSLNNGITIYRANNNVNVMI